jgi:putative membrane protein
VRAFAETLAREHAQAHGELGGLMRSKGVAVPTALPAEKTTKLQRLASLKPSVDFDMGFVRVVGVEDHRAAISRFERAQREARDRELRRWIDKTLPRLRDHLAAAQKLASASSG